MIRSFQEESTDFFEYVFNQLPDISIYEENSLTIPETIGGSPLTYDYQSSGASSEVKT